MTVDQLNQTTQIQYNKLKADLPNIRTWLVRLAQTYLPKKLKKFEEQAKKPFDQLFDITLSDILTRSDGTNFYRIQLEINGKIQERINQMWTNRLLNFRSSNTTQKHWIGFLSSIIDHSLNPYINGDLFNYTDALIDEYDPNDNY